MSSEQLGAAQNVLKGNLGGAWDITNGYQDAYTDLGIARRFGGSAAAYSLRDIGAMNGPVVKVRRDLAGEGNDPEINFSASQVQSGALEDWVNGKLIVELPADKFNGVTVVVSHNSLNSGASTTIQFFKEDNFTTSHNNPKFKSNDGLYQIFYGSGSGDWIFELIDTGSGATQYARSVNANVDFPYNVTDNGGWTAASGTLNSITVTATSPAAAAFSLRKVNSSYSGNAVRIRRTSDNIEVNVAFDSDDKVSASSAITNVAEQGGESGQTTATTLNGFLNPTYTVGTSVESASRTFNSFTSNGNDGFTATKTGGGSSTGGFPYTFATGDVISVSFDLVIADSASPTFVLSGNNMGSGSLGTGTTFTSSGSYTQELTTSSGTGTHLAFTDGNTGTFTVSNFKVTSHKAEAFVNTWYDQAGSNNAVQTTAANQPKIASSGALLADGLDFDGTDDKFEATDINNVNFPATIVSVSSTDVTGSNRGLYSLNTGTTAATGFYRSTNKYAINNGTSLEGSKTYSTGITNLKFDVFNGSSSTGFNNAVSDISGNAGTTQAQVTHFKIGDSDRTGIINQPLNGHIKEIILYTSDQSDNRFKIESNINNYYGLYNDANDLSGVFTTGSNGTFSGIPTKDGFTVQTNVSSSAVRANLKNPIPSLSSNPFTFHISFNANLNDPMSSGGNASPIVRLKNASDTQSNSAGTITNGFNSFSRDVNQNQGSDATVLEFFDNDVNTSYSISNIRISLIERNGFVNTWYDQSTSGNNAVQATADNQPSIVQNGGICKSNGSPSVFFTGDTRDDELDFTDLTLTDAAIFTVVNIDSSADQQLILGGSDSTSTSTMIPMMDNASSNTQVYKNSTVGGAEQGSSQFKNGSAVTLADRDDAYDNLAVNSQILFTMIDVDVAEAKVLDGISRCPSDALGFHLQGQMNELIIYNSDLSSDRGDIEAEIANHYSITLS